MGAQPQRPVPVNGTAAHVRGVTCTTPMIDELLSAKVAAVEAFSDTVDVPLFPEERAVVARAVDRRRREFANRVRLCARGLATIDARICWDRLLFSTKESVYEAWVPLVGTMLDFEQTRLTIDPAGAVSADRLVRGPVGNGRTLAGFEVRWLVCDGLIVTAIELAAKLSTPPRCTVICR